jgi:hypothetical protein
VPHRRGQSCANRRTKRSGEHSGGSRRGFRGRFRYQIADCGLTAAGDSSRAIFNDIARQFSPARKRLPFVTAVPSYFMPIAYCPLAIGFRLLDTALDTAPVPAVTSCRSATAKRRPR